MMAKIEWHKARDPALAYGAIVPGKFMEVAFMVKDSKRFSETNGWGTPRSSPTHRRTCGRYLATVPGVPRTPVTAPRYARESPGLCLPQIGQTFSAQMAFDAGVRIKREIHQWIRSRLRKRSTMIAGAS